MTKRYLNSASASEAAPYDTTASAAHQLLDFDVGVIATNLAKDDEIFVHASHSETESTARIYTSSPNATPEAPQRLICVSDFGADVTLVSTPSGKVANTGAGFMVFEGSWYMYGMVVESLNAALSRSIALGLSSSGPHNITAENCQFIVGAGSSSVLAIGNAGNSGNDETQVTLTDCVYKPNSSGCLIRLQHGQSRLNNLSLDAAGTAPTSLLAGQSGVTFESLLENSDLTGLSFTALFDSSGSVSGLVRVRNCKLPSGVTYCTNNITSPGMRFVLDDCTAGTTFVPYYRRSFSGEVIAEQTIIPNSASDRMFLRNDSSEPHAIKLAGHATQCTKWEPLFSDWIHLAVEDTATAITPFAEILVQGDGAAALKDNEVWLEVDAPTASGTNNHQGVRRSDTIGVLSTGTDQAAGTITWTGHGYSTPRTHRLALGASITPTQKGYLRIRVALAKANTSVFVGKVGVA